MAKSHTGPVILDVKGYALETEEREVLRHPQVGGVIFFGRNYSDYSQLVALTTEIRRIRPELLLCVDQEGGRVQRFRQDFSRLPAMGKLGDAYAQNPQDALAVTNDIGWLMASEVLSAGVDLSLAPVLDVDKAHSSVIADRAFSDRAADVVALAGAFITGMQEAGMKATGKHFPGHGCVIEDSHKELPKDPRPLAEIALRDLAPFEVLHHRLQAIMPAHIIFSAVDDMPVGFSRRWLQTHLKENMGYQGLIISDDLSMAGAAFAGDYPSRASLALEAGCDGILVCNAPTQAHAVIEHLERRNTPQQSCLQHLKASAFAPMQQLKKLPRWQEIQRKIAHLTET
jgi:beta-N-acetylhexosaminidase